MQLERSINFNQAKATMKTVIANIRTIDSAYFREIQRWFHGVQAPYGLQDILTFNAMYQHLYGRLDRLERQRVEEEIVEALIDGVETPDLKAKIFGVV